MKYTFTYESTINCNTKELFEFHANIANLPLITPPEIYVEIIHIDLPLKEGSRAALKIKKWPITFEWDLVFERIVYPYLIIDAALRSPFKTFRHEHRFIPVNAKCAILQDTVTFALPYAPLSNFLAFWVKRDLQKMFEYRHRQTVKHFEV